MVHSIFHKFYPSLPLSVSKVGCGISAAIKDNNCAIIIYETSHEHLSEHAEANVTKAGKPIRVISKRVVDYMSKKDKFDLSMNDKLGIHGKEYKINNFNLMLKGAKLLIYILVNEI